MQEKKIQEQKFNEQIKQINLKLLLYCDYRLDGAH